MRRKADPNIGYRTVEEIDRIFPNRKTAEQALNICNPAIRTWSEGNAPSTCYLQALLAHGADVLYILTGKRSGVSR